MNAQFPLLSLTSIALRLLGLVVVVGALSYTAYEGLYEPSLPRHKFGTEDGFQILAGLTGAILGLLAVGAGECVGVLFAIEANTREAAAALNRRAAA